MSAGAREARPLETGATAIRNAIVRAVKGDPLTQEPGDMMGPTVKGAADLIAQDPSAYWDTSCSCVKGSAYGQHSPRIFPIPYHPK